MVRALLEGRKTQTRRMVKLDQHHLWDLANVDSQDVAVAYFRQISRPKDPFFSKRCPYGKVGDRLWVRESWHLCPKKDKERYCYAANFYDETGSGCGADMNPKWSPSIHMHRWVSRIDLEITGVRVERVHEVGRDGRNAAHVKAEGLVEQDWAHLREWFHPDDCPALAFSHLWEKINGKGSWQVNPWVWVVEFRRVTA